MDKQKSAYSGRFADEQQARSPAAPRRKAAAVEPPRKPSGFSSAGQPPRHKSAPAAEEAEPIKKAKLHFKREKKEKPLREPGKRGPRLVRVLLALLIAVLVGLILLIAFGDRGTYHQMPIITREEAQPSFEPEKTPLPGVEEAI